MADPQYSDLIVKEGHMLLPSRSLSPSSYFFVVEAHHGVKYTLFSAKVLSVDYKVSVISKIFKTFLTVWQFWNSGETYKSVSLLEVKRYLLTI